MIYESKEDFMEALAKNNFTQKQLLEAKIVLDLISWKKTKGESLGVMEQIEDILGFLRKADKEKLEIALRVYEAIREVRYLL